MPDYIPKPDSEAAGYFDRAIDAFEAAPADFGIVAADATALRGQLTAFQGALTAAENAKTAATAAVAAKDAARLALENSFRPAVQQMQVNPAVSDANKTAAGLPIRDLVRSVTAPSSPVDLVAQEKPGGVHQLSWLPGGNIAGTQYVIEAKSGSATEFSVVDVVTRTTYTRNGQTPGVPVSYRVSARRGTSTSAPSNVAGVFI